MPGRYSHRQSVIAITQKGIRTERATDRRGGYERTPGLAICSRMLER
ncbi:hypothetical protein CDS [Bradyrhizobium sp.]|nr:hypothetical protein CDS [Bradyrhizobium sp.]